METNNLESIWKEYDKRLSDSLDINEKLIRRLTVNQAAKDVASIKRFEILWLIPIVVLLFFIVVWTMMYGHETVYLISGILSSFFIILSSVAAGLKKWKALTAMEQSYGGSVMETQRRILALDKQYCKYMRIEKAVMSLWIISFFPIVLKGLANIDFAHIHPGYLTLAIVVALAFAYLFAFLQHKSGYESRIKNMKSLLNQMEEFEREKSDARP